MPICAIAYQRRALGDSVMVEEESLGAKVYRAKNDNFGIGAIALIVLDQGRVHKHT